jgi:mannose-6-phosphate isomerase-like protein (cupin superfamily)
LSLAAAPTTVADIARGFTGGKAWRGCAAEEASLFKILHLRECPTNPMEAGRGEQVKLINKTLGTEKVDVHLNRLVPGGPRGKVHHHTRADNVYIVKRGEGKLTVEGDTFVIREDDVIYIPAGMKHSLSNLGTGVLELFEIYAPAGQHFDFIADQ